MMKTNEINLINQFENKANDLEKNIDQLTEEIKICRSKEDKFKNQIDSLDKDNEKYKDKYQKLKKEKSDFKNQIFLLENKIFILSAENKIKNEENIKVVSVKKERELNKLMVLFYIKCNRFLIIYKKRF